MALRLYTRCELILAELSKRSRSLKIAGRGEPSGRLINRQRGANIKKEIITKAVVTGRILLLHEQWKDEVTTDLRLVDVTQVVKSGHAS